MLGGRWLIARVILKRWPLKTGVIVPDCAPGIVPATPRHCIAGPT
jgi:hypothetical protein